MDPWGNHNSDPGFPPTMILGFVLMAIFVVAQFLFFFCVVRGYRALRQKIIDKGRLIQALPFIAVATIGQPVGQFPPPPQVSHFTAAHQQQQMTAPTINSNSFPLKDQPPPYSP